MAAVSPSPSPASSYPSVAISTSLAMSSRRMPLSANPNVANSPIRNSSLASALGKQRHQKRAYASIQREEPYATQPPPEKKRHLNDGSEKALRTPIRQVKVIRRDPSRPHKEEKSSHLVAAKAAQPEDEGDRMRRWKEVTTRNFPTYVFYFESCPQDQRPRLVKHLAQLGAREEKFFSKDITHVITTRSVPVEKATRHHTENASISLQNQRDQHDMPKTIDPSLLSRDSNAKDVRRRLLESTSRKIPANQALEDSVLRQPATTRHTDILVRAQEMNKKIWHYSKLVRVFEVMFDEDSRAHTTNRKGTEETNLAQLLNKERTTGPSDRDPTVATRELVAFKGPYIYIYDIEEKHKPVMIREYAKVADKKDGDWPQFRATSNGRCPFVEEEDPHERKRLAEKQAREKQRQERKEKTLADKVPELKPPPIPTAQAVTGKRSLAEMEDGHNSRKNSVRVPEIFDLQKAANPPTIDFTRPQNAFTSRARSARLFAGEPVASGMQPSHVTSAIRSQMISSATGVLGTKAGTSKELHGLQRKVLQKSNATSANPTSQDLSSRRLAEMSLDTSTYQRSASLGNTSRKLNQVGEEGAKEHKRTMSVPMAAPLSKPKKRDLKPGYCENCQDKFSDFEEHILSKKHRKFAENDENWSKLDALLSQLDRVPKYSEDVDDEASDW